MPIVFLAIILIIAVGGFLVAGATQTGIIENIDAGQTVTIVAMISIGILISILLLAFIGVGYPSICQ